MLKTNAGEIIGNVPTALIRRKAVSDKTGLGRSAIYQRMAEGTFPKQVKLGRELVAWVESEVDAWIAERIAERDSGAAA